MDAIDKILDAKPLLKMLPKSDVPSVISCQWLGVVDVLIEGAAVRRRYNSPAQVFMTVPHSREVPKLIVPSVAELLENQAIIMRLQQCTHFKILPDGRNEYLPSYIIKIA